MKTPKVLLTSTDLQWSQNFLKIIGLHSWIFKKFFFENWNNIPNKIPFNNTLRTAVQTAVIRHGSLLMKKIAFIAWLVVSIAFAMGIIKLPKPPLNCHLAVEFQRKFWIQEAKNQDMNDLSSSLMGSMAFPRKKISEPWFISFWKISRNTLLGFGSKWPKSCQNHH